MVDIKDAVARAIQFATDILGPERAKDIRLEEIESYTVDGRPVWLITLSNPKPVTSTSFRDLAVAFGGAEIAREYKVFAVTKDDGEVLSMKIRVFDSPVHA